MIIDDEIIELILITIIDDEIYLWQNIFVLKIAEVTDKSESILQDGQLLNQYFFYFAVPLHDLNIKRDY